MPNPHDKGRGYYAKANRTVRDSGDDDPLHKTGMWNDVGEEKRDKWVPLMDMTEEDDEFQDPFQIAADMEDID